jgi:SAM-dependent methyltransferase
MPAPEELQAEYYRRTASEYDAIHGADDEHARALRFVSQLIDERGLTSVLDVGCGTGRGVKHFVDRHPGLHVRGVEPIQALIDRAVETNGVPRELIVEGKGESLAFPDQSFDVVCEFGVLHHVAKPANVVSEMIRVAKRAVILSDSNRFGQGRMPTRWLKLGLYKLGVWRAVDLLNTRGRGYFVTEGDGVSYSYSVYDNYRELAEWATQIILIPSFPHTSSTWLSPLLTSGHVVLCALR